MIRGGQDVGKALVGHPNIDTLHITGSHITHDAIVWGADAEQREQRRRENNPLVTKPITSELGNVSPWIVVPGRYTSKQLQAQAEHVVASIVNNASFNCVATKMIVTSSDWPQREQFLGLVESLLDRVPQRIAYYPGARERFQRATGEAAPNAIDGSLSWTLIRDANPDESSPTQAAVKPEPVDLDKLQKQLDAAQAGLKKSMDKVAELKAAAAAEKNGDTEAPIEAPIENMEVFEKAVATRRDKVKLLALQLAEAKKSAPVVKKEITRDDIEKKLRAQQDRIDKTKQRFELAQEQGSETLPALQKGLDKQMQKLKELEEELAQFDKAGA